VISASNQTGLDLFRRGGVVVQLGMLPPGDTPFAGNLLVGKEIDLRGSFRFDTEFDDAVHLLAVTPSIEELISAVVPLDQAVAAFDLAAGPARCCCGCLEAQGVSRVPAPALPPARPLDMLLFWRGHACYVP
jgi:L-idonate 5-dehydrogenase